MPGGACEGTVYEIFGFICTGACVPLGNYHNMNQAAKKIGPEYINVQDWKNMVKLFVELAKNGHLFEPGHKELRRKIEKRFDEVKEFLERVDLGKSPAGN